MLLNKLYQVIEEAQGDNYLTVRISLNPEHFVYKAHFPSNPITPGVYLLQIIREIMSQYLHKSLNMYTVKNVKFLQVLNPSVTSEVTYNINWKQIDTKYETTITVENESVIYVKTNAILTEE